MNVQNPVLRGFNPDPSFLHVDGTYYLATSTFEWFPGVCIYRSTDLVNWEIASYALTDDQRLDMTGIDPACGIWAPNLTHCDGLFYLVYTVVYTNRRRYKDPHNYLVTAERVEGPWSEPVFLNRSGFDPSLFHEGDKKYLVNMVIDHRIDREMFAGIDVQAYDPRGQRLIGEPVRVTSGTARRVTEGPNIVKVNDYYYLTLAEGGTLYNHCTTVLRSKNILGPYEENPNNPIMTALDQQDVPLQRAGHSQIIKAQDGAWYMAHLASRPIDGCSILGRESCIQNVEWTDDGWFRLSANQASKPEMTYFVPSQTAQKLDQSERVDFGDGKIPLSYMSLRRSFQSNGAKVVDGRLRLTGGDSVMGKYRQALVARRQQSFTCDFSTALRFSPRHLNHMAGLLVYYNMDNHYYLKMSRDEQGVYVNVTTVVNKELHDTPPVYLPEQCLAVTLRAKIRRESLMFTFAAEGQEEAPIGVKLDMRNISDERVEGNGFTGSMLGVACNDLQGDGVFADFLYLDYQEYPEDADR